MTTKKVTTGSFTRRPIGLAPDHFTPPARTPWGGTRIRGHYKRGLIPTDRSEEAAIGESWEISAGPELESIVTETGEPLTELLARDPIGMLGPSGETAKSTPLLVKLLDAGDNLSVQIHPSDDYPGLAADESGKPESWYILEASDGAGLYLGFREGVSREALRRAIEEEKDISAFLYFTPVRPGDYFLIEAGTPHAIGRGVTLVEPQRVEPGRRGVTYRYWDWNRRYDPQGQPAPDGEPRRLHIDPALDVTRWDAPREEALLDRIRLRTGPADGPARVEWLSGPRGALPSEHLWIAKISGSGAVELSEEPFLRGLTVVGGQIRLSGETFDVETRAGQSLLLPAALPSFTAHLQDAHAILSIAH